ncbi:hypothetical protein QFC24_002510 [Naganishia onofrii]|uniref:Uncharacterized protein n=1 Tax=Naganishia onofrii TaxID=1851511 RepID=A0ACC2XRU2_9TREE|nr:hypothetical protein QFC24_002510 [Naganishia onofrii]
MNPPVGTFNPEISSGLPIPELNRYPQPASREERYATPATSASDIAFNPTRRQFPATSVVTQEKLAGLLLASPEGQKALPAPGTQSTDIATSNQSTPSLTAVLAAVPASFTSGGILPKKAASSSVLDASGLPPRPPATRWHPKLGDEVPHAPDQYWPMVMYK